MKVYDEIDAAGGVDEWIAKDPENRGRCDLCGEVYDHLMFDHPSLSDVGEFVSRSDRYEKGDRLGSVLKHVIAHAQCGIDHGLELA